VLLLFGVQRVELRAMLCAHVLNMRSQFSISPSLLSCNAASIPPQL